MEKEVSVVTAQWPVASCIRRETAVFHGVAAGFGREVAVRTRAMLRANSNAVSPGLFFRRSAQWVAAFLFWVAGIPPAATAGGADGASYKNYRMEDVPWSIHVARIPRSGAFEFVTAHAKGAAIGLSTLTDQVASMDPALGTPVAAVNGDFYQRDKEFAGDPRGLQIVNGEMWSAPNGGDCFWVDAQGVPHAEPVVSHLKVAWPNGTKISFGLNGARGSREAELYTPALGTSTHAGGDRELTLERGGDGAWLPFRPWEAYVARVRAVSDTGNSALTPDTMVLSLSHKLAESLPALKAGETLQISTATTPSLKGVRAAIGGGPLVVSRHRAIPVKAVDSASYQSSTMVERHPRTAIGWNKDDFFLVVVDGRQEALSVGMTLEELARYMVSLGCDEAMNLDGGGSSELWFEGSVRNSPCDRKERDIANSLIVVRRPPGAPQPSSRKP